MPASNLSDLAARVRCSAIVLDNGEVMWPFGDAADAINDLVGMVESSSVWMRVIDTTQG